MDEREISMTIRLVDNKRFTVTLYDSESNDRITYYFDYDKKTVEKVGDRIGAEVLGWVEYMLEGVECLIENNEGS